MKERLYKKELYLTLLFFILLMIFGHFAQLFVIFPGLQGGSFMGFPVHYILPILVGWFGLIILTTILAYVMNKFDDEMQEFIESKEGEESGE
ncbi:MAG: hypothetical protein V5A74_10125 [Desulfohalobiaceae bacterium]